MKNRILSAVILTVSVASFAFAQIDSTDKKYKNGMAIYTELGLLPSNKTLRNELDRLGVKPFTSFMGSLVFARRQESEKWFSEGRLILMNSTNYTEDQDERRAYLGGIGLGLDFGPKLVNTTRWNVLVPLGYDLMLYQLKIKNNRTASIGQVLQNPSSFQSVKLYTGAINLHAGLGVDYKINFFPKIHDKVFLSAKATYHLPVLTKTKWKGDDVIISDLSPLKLNQVYLQLGIVFFPKNNGKMWHGMN